MRDRDMEFVDTFRRVRDFGIENAADFPAASVGGQSFAVFVQEIPKVEASHAMQVSNVGREATVSKESAAAEIVEDMREINRTARSVGVDQPQIAALFRMHHDSGYQTLLAAATAFHTNSAPPNEALLISYGLLAAFRADLQSDIEDLQTAIAGQNDVKTQKASATGAAAASMKPMNEALRRLRGIVPNVYRNNPAKLAAWAAAAHVARPPKTKKGKNGEPTPAPHG